MYIFILYHAAKFCVIEFFCTCPHQLCCDGQILQTGHTDYGAQCNILHGPHAPTVMSASPSSICCSMLSTTAKCSVLPTRLSSTHAKTEPERQFAF